MSQSPLLPALRQELHLLSGGRDSSGQLRWLIFDPLRNAYQQVSERAFKILRLWREEPVSLLQERANFVLEQPLTDGEVLQLTEFLYANRLTQNPPGNDPSALAIQEDETQKTWWEVLVHKYLFFRVPLFRPDNFLALTYPFVAPFYKARLWGVMLGLCVIALYFTSRQWDTFVQTFLHFLTFEGLVFYGLTLLVLKSFHELGHAWTAHHFGCKVPIIGVAFLVMFPVLYTDTTNAWALPERKKRLLIDAGGMAAELIIAIFSLLLWSFLPDGPWRSAAFFAATTSLGLSLLVNLNPFMRFDGYYLLGDLCGISNLQETGFAIGRWQLRKSLWGLDDPCPKQVTARARSALTLYAWGTWIYRFFLFIGIALFVHAIFPRAIGIILFIVEIAWFIGKPVLDEAKVWWTLRDKIYKTLRGRLTLLLWGAVVIALFVPWRSTIYAPALLQPAARTDLYPPHPAQIEQIHIAQGDRVEKGALLFTLTSPDLAVLEKQTMLRITLLEARLGRRVSSQNDLNNSDVLLRELRAQNARLEGLQQLKQDLIITAPHAGQMMDLPPDLHSGRWVAPALKLASLIEPERAEIIAYPEEKHAARLHQGARLTFVADDSFQAAIHGNILEIAPTGQTALATPLLSSTWKGPIAVRRDEKEREIPASAILKLTAQPTSPRPAVRIIRGKVKIEAAPESPAKAISKSITRVLLREADF